MSVALKAVRRGEIPVPVGPELTDTDFDRGLSEEEYDTIAEEMTGQHSERNPTNETLVDDGDSAP